MSSKWMKVFLNFPPFSLSPKTGTLVIRSDANCFLFLFVLWSSRCLVEWSSIAKEAFFILMNMRGNSIITIGTMFSMNNGLSVTRGVTWWTQLNDESFLNKAILWTTWTRCILKLEQVIQKLSKVLIANTDRIMLTYAILVYLSSLEITMETFWHKFNSLTWWLNYLLLLKWDDNLFLKMSECLISFNVIIIQKINHFTFNVLFKSPE